MEVKEQKEQKEEMLSEEVVPLQLEVGELEILKQKLFPNTIVLTKTEEKPEDDAATGS